MTNKRATPFDSNIVDNIRAAGGVLTVGNGRRIILPSAFGFCSGVRRAVAILARTLHDNPDRKIWLLGAMIHNPAVNHWFTANGVTIAPSDTLESVFQHASPGDIFTIPAFGLPVNIDARLRDFVSPPGLIVDTTCPFVRRVWAAAENAGRAGDAVLIHGKYGHQETDAIWSRALATAPACALLPTPRDALAFANNPNDIPEHCIHNRSRLLKVAWTLVNQTTMLASETAQVADILANTTWHADIPFRMAGTLCTATRERQAAAIALCRTKCDCIIVLGGTDSSNTTQLYRLAAANITPDRCWFIEDASNITPKHITHFIPHEQRWHSSNLNTLTNAKTISILTGASCPDSELARLIQRLTTLH